MARVRRCCGPLCCEQRSVTCAHAARRPSTARRRTGVAASRRTTGIAASRRTTGVAAAVAARPCSRLEQPRPSKVVMHVRMRATRPKVERRLPPCSCRGGGATCETPLIRCHLHVFGRVRGGNNPAAEFPVITMTGHAKIHLFMYQCGTLFPPPIQREEHVPGDMSGMRAPGVSSSMSERLA